MHSLSITELEKISGAPRSTIYFYVREGLLPTAQKAAASRAVYSHSHIELLGEISRLREQGFGLQEIKRILAPMVAKAEAAEIDLVAEQAEQIRRSILAAAARLFARKGYKRTRVADIIKEVGVTPPVFYNHFASKQELFVESFGLFVSWMHDFIEGRLATEPDPAARDLTRVQGYFGVQALSPDLMSLVRSEAFHEDGEMRKVVERSYSDMTHGTLEDLHAMREQGGVSLPAPDELVAFALLGALENVVMRASWDNRFSVRDVLWTDLCIFLAVQSLFTGRLDLSADLKRYAPLLDKLAGTPPPVPPAAV
ncbi:MAG: TetR family transcriptional regulator [Actinobacteria bacterium]|nr:TetR family transcriptional regulator [Actinomycetota bacterium]